MQQRRIYFACNLGKVCACMFSTIFSNVNGIVYGSRLPVPRFVQSGREAPCFCLIPARFLPEGNALRKQNAFRGTILELGLGPSHVIIMSRDPRSISSPGTATGAIQVTKQVPNPEVLLACIPVSRWFSLLRDSWRAARGELRF